MTDYFAEFVPDNETEAPAVGAQRGLTFADLHTNFLSSANRFSNEKTEDTSAPFGNAKLLPNVDLINNNPITKNGSQQQASRIGESVLEALPPIGAPSGDNFKSGLFSIPPLATASSFDSFRQPSANVFGQPLSSKIDWRSLATEQLGKKPEPIDSAFGSFNKIAAHPWLSSVLSQLEQPEPTWDGKVTQTQSAYEAPTANVELTHRRLQTTFGLDTQANGQMPSFYANQKLGKHFTLANGLDGLRDTMTLTADTRFGSMDLYTNFDKNYGMRFSAPLSSRVRLGLNVGQAASGGINYGLNVEIRKQDSR